MSSLNKLLVKSQESRGQTMAEYALILGLIAFAAIGAWTAFGTSIPTGALSSLASSL